MNALFFSIVMVVGLAAGAQKPTDVAHWTVTPDKLTVAPGGTGKVTLTARIQDGWHLYAISQPKGGPPPMVIAIASSQPFEVRGKEIEAPPPQTADDPDSDTEAHYWEGQVAIVVPVTAKKGAAPGAHRLPIDVTFQLCSGRMCLRPFTQSLFVDATIMATRREP